MTRTLYLLLIVAAFMSCLLWRGIACSAESLPSGNGALIDKYYGLGEKLVKSPFGKPIYLESSVDKNSSSVDMYGVIDYSFDTIQKELTVPSSWCDLILLHINIRACTCSRTNNTWLLTLYNVNKYYQPLDEAYQLKYVYRISSQQPAYLDMLFFADEGPFHSHDHRLRFEAAPVDEKRTFVHLSYSYQYNVFEYMAMKSYFGLFGGGRVGFSVTGTDSQNNPVYIGGVKGAVERNVVRYYLAILAYMDTLKFPSEHRFEKRIARWYELTAHYKKQLFEMEQKEYITYKRQDLKNQIPLQDASIFPPK